jgi:hypothetical protein
MSGSDQMVQISASELAILRRGYSMLEGLTQGEDGIDIQRRLKKQDPSLNFPVIDQGDKLIAPVRSELEQTKADLKALRDEREAEQQTARNNAANAEINASLDRAVEKYKLSKDARKGLLDFMIARNTADAELAAPAYMETLPKPPAPLKSNGFLPQTMHLFGTGDGAGDDADIAALHKDPLGWQDRKIAEIMNEDAA